MSVQDLVQRLASGKPVFIIWTSFISTLLGNYNPDKMINKISVLVLTGEAAMVHRD